MGLFRKVTSISTLGLVDFRSAKDRTASYSQSAARQARKQTKLMRAQVKQQQAMAAMQVAAPMPVQGPPPGWYVDPQGGQSRRWWDGYRWTEHLQ